MPRKPSPATGRDRLFSHVVLFIACVVFPALVTWIAPVSWISLTRKGERIEARVKVCLFFLVPFRTHELADVTGVEDHVRAGARQKFGAGNADDQRRDITSESEGLLYLHGPTEETVVVQVSPASLDKTAREIRELISDQERARPELRFFSAANWKVSVIVGGIMCLFTLLYLFVVISALFSRKTPAAAP
jgi:hypothetical protein